IYQLVERRCSLRTKRHGAEDAGKLSAEFLRNWKLYISHRGSSIQKEYSPAHGQNPSILRGVARCAPPSKDGERFPTESLRFRAVRPGILRPNWFRCRNVRTKRTKSESEPSLRSRFDHGKCCALSALCALR